MNIVVNSKFNPFTYEQLVKPLEDYTKAYNEVEEQYADLLKQTETFRDIATQENSPESYAMFSKYAKDLETVTDDFSRGMTMANRRQLLGLKRRYAKEITPIARADAARQEAIKYRRDVKARDDSAIFKVDNFSLDDFLHGGTVNEDYVSGKNILARTSAKAEALGKSLFSDPEFKTILGGQKYQISQQNGLTPEMFYAVVNDQLDNPNISKALRTKLQGFRQIMDDELANVADWGDAARQQVLSSVTTGMYAGLAKPTYQFTENGEYINAAQRRSLANQEADLRLQQDQFDYAKKKDRIASGAEPYYTSTDGKTKFFSNGKVQWTETWQPGVKGKSEGKWVSTTPTPTADVVAKAKANRKPLGNIHWRADNAQATNPNSRGDKEDKENYVISGDVQYIQFDQLSPVQQQYVKRRLAGTGYDVSEIEIAVKTQKTVDDHFWIVPKVSDSSTTVTVTDDDSNAGIN